MQRLGQGLTLIFLIAMAWLIWQPPAPAPDPSVVIAQIPEPPVARHQPKHPVHSEQSGKDTGQTAKVEPPAPAQHLWRVVTRRIVWRAAVKTLAARLKESGLKPIRLKRREPVIMHAFDDASLFATAKAAEAAKKQWQKKHIEASVIKTNIEIDKDIYMVGLGRFYLTEYAEQIQNRLKQIGKPYRYERRTVTIPVYRFSFPPRPKREAEQLWQQLQDLGVATPVLMPEKEFQKAYGKKKN